MKVAITGGNGHIGNAIIEELLTRGYQIKALAHRKSDYLKQLPIEIIHGSVLDKTALKSLIHDCDYLIHCAAIISISGDPDGKLKQINVEGLKNLLDVASEFSLKRIIHVSSVHAYQQIPVDEVLNEQREFVGNNAYAYDKSKRDGQQLCKAYCAKGLPIIVVNPTAVFGPPNYALCKQNNAFIAMSKGKIPFVFKGGYNWVDVRDVAFSICNALTQGQIGESYILGGKYYTLKELSKVVAKVSKRKLPCIELPIGLVKFFLPLVSGYYKLAKQDPSLTRESLEILKFGNKQVSSDKANKHLGHTPRHIEATMIDLFTWHKKRS